MPAADRHDAAPGDPRQELKTFMLEVSAGRPPQGVGDATQGTVRRVDAPVRRETADPSSSGGQDANEGPDQSSAEQVAAAADEPAVARETPDLSELANQAIHVDVARPPRRSQAVKRWPMLVSAALHTVFVAVLVKGVIAQLPPPDEIELSIGQQTIEDFDLAEAEFAAEAMLDEALADEASELIDPGVAALGLESDAAALAALVDEPALTGASGPADSAGEGLGDLGSLLGDPGGQGAGASGEGFGDAPLPQFFGARIEGRRIVFVLDNSGSMQAGRLETVIAELLRCVESLTPDQEFYVAFYSDAVYPLFYPDPVAEYIRPTDRNKRLLAEWLETVELCLGDSVLDALNAAASIDPDTVILLSDGRIQGERKMSALLAGGGDFPLHTIGIGLGAGAVVSRRNLAEIAAANGGDFREAPIPDEMRELARDNPRPYHSDGPGPIWGRNVKARR